jgi:2-polyprenyl-3-methyl-5-hydroxy-6-metoxy-1,4-benzoquinol methylase
MNDRLDSLACPVCMHVVGNVSSPRLYIAPFNKQEYTLHLCGNCELGFWTPLKIDPAFYEDEGFGAYTDYHQGERPFPPWCVPFFDKMQFTKGRLLDVGCGDGAFLARAKSVGFETWGMDLDKNSVQAAKANYGLENISHTPLEAFVGDCKAKGVTFDVITFFEVLEHQDRPSEFVDQALSILKPEGVIAGSVPNGRRFLAAVDRRVSSGDLPPHHFLWFSKETLGTLLAKKNLTSIMIYPSGNIPFKELRRKFSTLIFSSNGSKRPPRILQAVVFPFVMVATTILWISFKVGPAHLYFQAVKPANCHADAN